MRLLTASELLQIWEMGIDSSVLNSGIQLLNIAYNMPGIQDAAQLSIGERDARLLLMREKLFGKQLVSKAQCPKCAETVEWEMSTTEMLLQSPQLDSQPKIFELEIENFHLQFRLPNSEDILKQMDNNSKKMNSRQLLFDCIIDVKAKNKKYNITDLPEVALEMLMQQMEKEDPQSNLSLSLNCPVCSNQWTAVFNILSYLWAEIDNWAKHLLQEIYVLARAFGWSERDIVNMSSRRRQMYLEMLRA